MKKPNIISLKKMQITSWILYLVILFFYIIFYVRNDLFPSFLGLLILLGFVLVFLYSQIKQIANHSHSYFSFKIIYIAFIFVLFISGFVVGFDVGNLIWGVE